MKIATEIRALPPRKTPFLDIHTGAVASGLCVSTGTLGSFELPQRSHLHA